MADRLKKYKRIPAPEAPEPYQHIRVWSGSNQGYGHPPHLCVTGISHILLEEALVVKSLWFSARRYAQIPALFRSKQQYNKAYLHYDRAGNPARSSRWRAGLQKWKDILFSKGVFCWFQIIILVAMSGWWLMINIRQKYSGRHWHCSTTLLRSPTVWTRN